jgi:hypothetical protein
MEKRLISLPDRHQFYRNPNERIKFKTLNFTVLALAAALMLTASPARANNLLVNPGFEIPPSGQIVPTGWTYFAPPTLSPTTHDYWVAGPDYGAPALFGTFFWKQWGALNNGTNNVAGIYQTFSSAPGATYQASGWFYSNSHDNGGLGADCITWIDVAFLGASSNVLALYKSPDFSASVGLDTWFPYSVTNACDMSSPVPTGDPYFTTYAVTGSVSQLVAPLGTTTVRYRYAFLQAGTNSALWKGSAYLDEAVLNQTGGFVPPVITNLFPVNNMIFVNPNDGLSFNVSSPSGFTISNSAIHLVLNGVDVSGSLAISGSSSNKNAAYYGLQSNLTYTASISVTDASNLTASASTYFETTWVGIEPVTYLWEAEDFDYTNGMYLNNPDLCSASGDANCYFGKVGEPEVDEHNLNGGGSHLYRPDDLMGTAASGDYLRKNLFEAVRLDYCINPFNYSEWVNYTRDWPNSTNWVVARLATDVGLSGTLTLSRVNPNTTTTDLGTFTVANGRGWTAYDNVYLKDTNGFLANVILNGKAALRVTSGGNLLPGFFMLVAAQVDLPHLINLYPTGTHPFEHTNTLSFTITTTGATFPPGGIKVNLDGIDVSSSLVITGSASSNNAVYPGLLPNAIHTAIITVTNSLGHGIRVTNNFDTFSQDNYMVEAEDFDYDGGQYVAPWFPDAYLGLGATTNIDFQHITEGGEQFPYLRTAGIPESLVQNYAIEARQKFIDVGESDYELDWFGASDWANYTRAYPAGNFYAYVRSSGGLGSSYSIYLDQVISGAGTTNQVTKRLGTWGAVGGGRQTYAWVPLTDDGLVAPIVVKLSGVSTLRVSTTTGLCYPNYFMLVSASGITLSAARSGSNVNISFPTQAGVAYRVFYRNDLNAGSWTVLTTVLGDGTVKSVSDPSTAAKRFYKVVAP